MKKLAATLVLLLVALGADAQPFPPEAIQWEAGSVQPSDVTSVRRNGMWLRTEAWRLSAVPAITVSANYTVDYADVGKTIVVTTGSSDITVTFPSGAQTGNGAFAWVQKADAGTGKVIVATPSASNAAWLRTQSDIVMMRVNQAAWQPIVWTISPYTIDCTVTCTWSKPPLLTRTRVILYGGGGGGASGARQPSGTASYGGGGGAGGACIDMTIPAASLVSATITVAGSAAGGAAQTSNGASGNAGTFGVSTTFGSFAAARGGQNGAGGTTSSGTGGVTSAVNSTCGVGGGAGGSSSIVTAQAGTAGVSGGAGAGGGIDTSNNPIAGAAGAFGSAPANTRPAVGSGGAVNASGTAGGAVTSASLQFGGSGGGGGGASITGVAGSGGAGGYPAGGGGGGGASRDGNNSGAGGAGGAGFARTIDYFN